MCWTFAGISYKSYWHIKDYICDKPTSSVNDIKCSSNAVVSEFMNEVMQHDLTTRIYDVLHKITIALKFMSYINQKLRPSYQTALNLCLT